MHSSRWMSRGRSRQVLISSTHSSLNASLSTRGGSEAYLSPELVTALATRPWVRAVEEQRRLRVQIGALPDRQEPGREETYFREETPFRGEAPFRGRPVLLSGVNIAGAGAAWETRMPLMAGEPAVVLARMLAGEVLISEPLARKEGLAPGDSVRVLGPRGPFDLRIAGVTYDYTSEGGTAFLDLPAFARHIGPGPTNNMALFVVPGQEVEAAVDELKAAYRGRPLTFRSNRKLREEILEIFDQTFAVTRILQGM